MVSGQPAISDSKNFSVLDSLTATALSTLYPISDGESLPGDLVILQLDVSANVKDIAIDSISSKPKVTVSGDLISQNLIMIVTGDFHEALLAKWGVASTADYLLPLTIPAGAVPGSFSPIVKAEDTAGQEFTTSSTANPATSPGVKVVSSRSSINVYLMPTFSFVTPALECAVPASPLCTGDNDREFDLAELLKQTVPRSQLNDAFLDASPAITADNVRLSEIVEIIAAYDPSIPDFTLFRFDPLTDSLRSARAGRGYIVKTKTKTAAKLEPFRTEIDGDNAQFPSDPIPVPIKLTFTGKFLVNPSEVPVGTPVTTRWNLVGPFSEVKTTVGSFLIGVTVPRRQWEQLFAFRNLLDISLDSAGKVKFRADGIPKIVFKKRLETLRAPAGEPDAGDPALPSGSAIPAGSGLWLFMCETPVADCVGGELLPVGLPAVE